MNRLVALLLVLLTALSACRPEEPAAQPTASQTAAPSGEGVVARIETEGAPSVGPTPVTVYLLDGDAGVSGASVEVTGDMTHAGMTPIITAATEVEPGLYRAEDFEFTMAGDWVLTADVALPDGQRLSSETQVSVPND